MVKIHVKKDDMVYVLNGKDRGRKGKVLKVIPSEHKVLVEGVNMVTKHVKPKPNQSFKQDGLVHQFTLSGKTRSKSLRRLTRHAKIA